MVWYFGAVLLFVVAAECKKGGRGSNKEWYGILVSFCYSLSRLSRAVVLGYHRRPPAIEGKKKVIYAAR